jgi:hypothetical protein
MGNRTAISKERKAETLIRWNPPGTPPLRRTVHRAATLEGCPMSKANLRFCFDQLFEDLSKVFHEFLTKISDVVQASELE